MSLPLTTHRLFSDGPLSRRDITTIAQRFNAGFRGHMALESRRDRPENVSPLPGGEGRGEGERVIHPPEKHASRTRRIQPLLPRLGRHRAGIAPVSRFSRSAYPQARQRASAPPLCAETIPAPAKLSARASRPPLAESGRNGCDSKPILPHPRSVSNRRGGKKANSYQSIVVEATHPMHLSQVPTA